MLKSGVCGCVFVQDESSGGVILELGTEDVVPNLGCDTKAELKVLVVVFEMVLLHVFHVLG